MTRDVGDHGDPNLASASFAVKALALIRAHLRKSAAKWF
jgi:hypothetical protein